MDAQSWQIFKTLARYVISLAFAQLLAVVGVTALIIFFLDDKFTEKTTIIALLVGSIAGGFTQMVGGIGAAFVAISNVRRNVSVSEARGNDAGKE